MASLAQPLSVSTHAQNVRIETGTMEDDMILRLDRVASHGKHFLVPVKWPHGLGHLATSNAYGISHCSQQDESARQHAAL